MPRKRTKVSLPNPKMNDNYTVIRHSARSIYRVTYKPQFLLMNEDDGIEAVFNSLSAAKKFVDGKETE